MFLEVSAKFAKQTFCLGYSGVVFEFHLRVYGSLLRNTVSRDLEYNILLSTALQVCTIPQIIEKR